MSATAPHYNALARETSPYLLQHAHNPVDWYPWSTEALQRARAEDKPILLSIGYSACHWCHVMAHESFEDADTARVMNELFVNIKVDREERPDLDKIYQTAHHLLAQRAGGWPLTMFLTPDDQTPFFGGTYFPKESRFGLPAFRELLPRVADFYHHNQVEIRQQNASLVEALANTDRLEASGEVRIQPLPLDVARRQLQQGFDDTHGGFGQAPKFPHPTNIERLLRHYTATAGSGQADRKALEMAVLTLRRMAQGGLYDQLGGGFCRYSVDDQWMIPHFEKMLYDNGPLLTLYSEAWQVTGDPLFERVTRETAEWVIREMQSPAGGYYSTLDADSEGEEGKFYVWTRDEVGDLLDSDEYQALAPIFGLDRDPNFESKWHLHVYTPPEVLARQLGVDETALRDTLDTARRKLLARRETRVRPGRDEKVLTAWNGLMIKGMATAGRVFHNPDWVRSAETALDFIRTTLWRDGRLLATYKDDRARFAAYLDDYAFLIDGILALLQARWRDGDLRFALELAEVLLDAFEDQTEGGFYFTAEDHERLIHRPKPLADEALPAGNGIAAQVLGRLGHLLGEPRYLEAAERTLKAAWPAIMGLPYAHNALLLAVEEHLYAPQTIVIRGQGKALQTWQDRAGAHYAPRRLSLAIPADATDLPGVLAERRAGEGVVAYVCEGFQCGPPVHRLETLEVDLDGSEVKRAGGTTPA